MSEGAAQVECHVAVMIAEGDVRTHSGLRHGLSADVTILCNVIVFGAVLEGLQTITMGEFEHADLFAYNLFDDAGRAVEACSPEGRDGLRLRGCQVFIVIPSVE